MVHQNAPYAIWPVLRTLRHGGDALDRAPPTGLHDALGGTRRGMGVLLFGLGGLRGVIQEALWEMCGSFVGAGFG